MTQDDTNTPYDEPDTTTPESDPTYNLSACSSSLTAHARRSWASRRSPIYTCTIGRAWMSIYVIA